MNELNLVTNPVLGGCGSGTIILEDVDNYNPFYFKSLYIVSEGSCVIIIKIKYL